MLDGHQVVRVLRLPEEERVVPVRLHGVAGDDGAVQRQRGQQRLEVADLVGLPGLRDLILGDHDARDVGDRGEQVHFLLPAGLGELALLPSTATPWRAGTWPGSPQAAGSSHGCSGCGRNQPSSRSSRNFSAAGGFGFLFFRRSSFPRCCSARCAAYAAGTAGSSAAAATAADSAASSSSASSSLASLPSIDADGDARTPVRGQVQQPCAASTSWSQPAAACATASGPLSAAAAPAAITDTSDGSGCRFPRALRESVSRPSSDSRRDTGSSTAPAGRWRRMQSVSHDEDAGAVKAVLR